VRCPCLRHRRASGGATVSTVAEGRQGYCRSLSTTGPLEGAEVAECLRTAGGAVRSETSATLPYQNRGHEHITGSPDALSVSAYARAHLASHYIAWVRQRFEFMQERESLPVPIRGDGPCPHQCCPAQSCMALVTENQRREETSGERVSRAD
jgi:hypothetical protein